MKKQFIAFLVVFIVTPFVLASDVPTDGNESHGGDPMLQNFKDTGLILNKSIQNIPDFIFSIESKIRFSEVILNTQLKLKQSLIWQGQEVTAINYPQSQPQLIEVSAARWPAVYVKQDESLKLVLHEYLPLMGQLDDNYVVSLSMWPWLQAVNQGSLYRMMKLAKIEPNQWNDYVANKSVSFFFDYPKTLLLLTDSSQFENSYSWFQLFKLIADRVPDLAFQYGNLYLTEAEKNLQGLKNPTSQKALEYLKQKRSLK